MLTATEHARPSGCQIAGGHARISGMVGRGVMQVSPKQSTRRGKGRSGRGCVKTALQRPELTPREISASAARPEAKGGVRSQQRIGNLQQSNAVCAAPCSHPKQTRCEICTTASSATHAAVPLMAKHLGSACPPPSNHAVNTWATRAPPRANHMQCRPAARRRRAEADVCTTQVPLVGC